MNPSRQNFLSVDGKTARSSEGDFFIVGEEVAHQDEEAGKAIIERFEAKLDENEITVYTTKGFAHLDFIEKIVKSEPVKLYFSEEDAQDMSESFYKEEGQLWNTWTGQSEGMTIEVELWLGNEDDIKEENTSE